MSSRQVDDPGPRERLLHGRPLVPGEASGRLIVTKEALSFWGGYDPQTGEVTDRTHPLSGVIVAGAVLALPETKGSSTTTAVLLEAIRRGTAPAALVTRGVDSFLVLAAIVAEEMYGEAPSVVALDTAGFESLEGGRCARVDAQGGVTIVDDQPDPMASP